jgi:hypothetical protein
MGPPPGHPPMRLIAYIQPQDDAAAVRDHLRTLPGITAVSMRSGRHWRPGDLPEHGAQRIWAPGYPGILAAYAAAGVPALDSTQPVAPLHLDELLALPSADTVTIVCHGKYAAEEIAAVGTVGVVIAVNHSGLLLGTAPEYLVANDGIVNQVVGAPGRVRCVRRSHIPTLPSGPWYAIDGLGITTGMFSVRCALRLAQLALSARHIRLIGHDCLPGAGALPGTWGSGHIAMCKRDTASDLARIAAQGVEIEHVGWDAKRRAVTHTDYKA